MHPPLRPALDRLAAAGVRYGAVRLVETTRERLGVRDDAPEQHQRSVDRGFHVRVLDGGHGFAATPRPERLAAAADRAIALARSSAPFALPDRPFPPGEARTGTWRAPVEVDPFELSAEERFDVLLRASRLARAELSAEGSTEASAVCTRVRTWYADTEGSSWFQEQVCTGASLQATAVAGTRFQRRSFPKGEEGNLGGRGWEHVIACDLPGNAARIGAEARQLLDAPPCPAGQHTIILDGSQLSLQIHESCGHPTEGDRALGEEQSLAGGSFLQPDRLGSRYGSDLVTLTADSLDPGAAGSFGWDDEGNPATREDLVRDGIFVGYLTGRESAARLGVPNTSSQRAEGWRNPPINRMVNVSLAPGEAGSLADLIGNTERGLLLSSNKSWSIDQLRLNFQFGCEAAWEIRDGQLGQLYRDPVYTGVTPRFWAGCDAICGPEEWKQWGWMYCGKGDPMQIMFVSHGCAPARFRNVTVEAR